MNPQVQQILAQMQKRIDALEAEVSRRKANQIQIPLDDVSKNVIIQSLPPGSKVGSGSWGTQSATVSGGSVTVPAQPSGTIKISFGGTVYEIPIK